MARRAHGRAGDRDSCLKAVKATSSGSSTSLRNSVISTVSICDWNQVRPKADFADGPLDQVTASLGVGLLKTRGVRSSHLPHIFTSEGPGKDAGFGGTSVNTPQTQLPENLESSCFLQVTWPSSGTIMTYHLGQLLLVPEPRLCAPWGLTLFSHMQL